MLHRTSDLNLYASSNIVRAIKSMTGKWAGHVARMWSRNAYIFTGDPEGRIPLEYIDIDRRII